MEKYKYKEYHDALKCYCPPKEGLSPLNMTAYRWIHSDLEHQNNFLPPLIIEPTRIDSFETCEIKCENYALSFFNDQNKAESKLKKYIKRKPLLANVLGSAIGKVDIIEDDGKGSLPRNDGHFNFHEFCAFDLKNKLTFVKEINIEK